MKLFKEATDNDKDRAIHNIKSVRKCWDIVHDLPKWKLIVSDKDDDSSERPMGQKSAKKAKIEKESSESAILDLVQVQKDRQQFMKQQHAEIQEMQIMAMDLTKMSETQQRFFKLRQEQILQRWMNKSITDSLEESKHDLLSLAEV